MYNAINLMFVGIIGKENNIQLSILLFDEERFDFIGFIDDW